MQSAFFCSVLPDTDVVSRLYLQKIRQAHHPGRSFLCFKSSKCTPGFILPNRIVPHAHMRGCFGCLKPEGKGCGIPCALGRNAAASGGTFLWQSIQTVLFDFEPSSPFHGSVRPSAVRSNVSVRRQTAHETVVLPPGSSLPPGVSCQRHACSSGTHPRRPEHRRL